MMLSSGSEMLPRSERRGKKKSIEEDYYGTGDVTYLGEEGDAMRRWELGPLSINSGAFTLLPLLSTTVFCSWC